MTDRKSDEGQVGFFIIRGACCLALIATIFCLAQLLSLAQETSAVSVPSKSEATMSVQKLHPDEAPATLTMTQEERIELIEKSLTSIREQGEKQDSRSISIKWSASS